MFAGQFEDYTASSTHLYDGVKFCNSEKMIFISHDPEPDSEDNTSNDLKLTFYSMKTSPN